MAATSLSDDIDTFLAEFIRKNKITDIAVIGKFSSHSLPEKAVSLGHLQDIADIPPTLRVDLALVVNQLETMQKDDAAHLISRLRDNHAKRVLLVTGGSELGDDELRALGLHSEKRLSDDRRCFVFDPDKFSAPREWNNPSDWANPENFRKFRW